MQPESGILGIFVEEAGSLNQHTHLTGSYIISSILSYVCHIACASGTVEGMASYVAPYISGGRPCLHGVAARAAPLVTSNLYSVLHTLTLELVLIISLKLRKQIVWYEDIP